MDNEPTQPEPTPPEDLVATIVEVDPDMPVPTRDSDLMFWADNSLIVEELRFSNELGTTGWLPVEPPVLVEADKYYQVTIKKRSSEQDPDARS